MKNAIIKKIIFFAVDYIVKYIAENADDLLDSGLDFFEKKYHADESDVGKVVMSLCDAIREGLGVPDDDIDQASPR